VSVPNLSYAEQKMQDSHRRFRDVVWPDIGPLIGGGDLIPVETDKARLSVLLDVEAGIDWYVRGRFGLYGLASRVQVDGRAWNTFTIRTRTSRGGETEWTKRRRAIRDQYHFPHITCQAYLDRAEGLLSVATVTTDHLFEVAEKYPQQERYNGEDGHTFRYVYWRQLDSHKITTAGPRCDE
jgi:hypothetical protein